MSQMLIKNGNKKYDMIIDFYSFIKNSDLKEYVKRLNLSIRLKMFFKEFPYSILLILDILDSCTK